MICNLCGVLHDRSLIELLNRSGNLGVQLLPACNRDAGKQCLTYQFMGEGEGNFRPLGTGNDHSHSLSLIDNCEELVNIDLADSCQKLKTETSPDDRGSIQSGQLRVAETSESPADDQAHVFRHLNLIDLEVHANSPRAIEDLSLLDQ